MSKIAEPTEREGRKLTPASDGSRKHQQQLKKKDRPSSRPEALESESRRSLRQLRRRQYYCDYYEDFDDDFVEDLALDDDEEEDEEQETKRKEKKLNLVLEKAASPPGGPHHHPQYDLPAAAAAVAADSTDCDNREERHPLKKRRISGFGDANGKAGDDGVRSIRSGVEKERTEGGVEQAGTVSAPGSPSSESRAAATPLPDRKVLELILDKLQKKDTYGVYAEPVDPEELPDYHDAIKNPMDFATVRKKLTSGAYSTLYQLENDVFLICSNAMQYNAPDTIYFKQARAIQELARKKFDKLKADEIKSVQKTRTTFETEKPIKKHLTSLQEHGGSDFSLGTTFAAPKVACAFPNNTRDGGVEKPVNGNVHNPATDGDCFSTEKQMDRLEDVLAKESPLKFGRKLSVLDENRRATYVSNQLWVQTDCIFTTFESETKQLIAVGLHADHSYARSLARFAAVLGPTAWAVASRKIEQALPAGCKFGRGWVGEYEPLPTPVLTLENHVQTQLPFKGVSCERADLKKDRQKETTKVRENGGHKNLRLRLGSNLNASSDVACHVVPNAIDESNTKRATLEGRPVLFGSPAVCQQPKKSRAIESANHETSVLRQSDFSPSMNGNTVEVASLRLDHNPEVQSSGLLDIFSRKNSGGATLFKQPEVMIFQGGQPPFQAGSSMGLPNGSSISSSDGVKTSQLSLDSGHKHPFGLPSILIPNNCQQGLDDPVQLMRKLSEKAAMGQTQLNNPGNAANGIDERIMPSAPYAPKPENPSAAAAAARAWMSIGPASPYIPVRKNLIPVTVKSENKYFAALPASQAVNVSGEAQQHDRGSLVGFPQNIDADSQRFQLKSHWQGRTNAQKGQRRDMLPPDLNIGFQGPGSPVRQSSGILVDSLALQL